MMQPTAQSADGRSAPTAVSKDGRIRFFMGDCMTWMRQMPDNAYELAVVDPPYGIKEDGHCRTRKKHNNNVKHKKKDWDNERPTPEYWKELFRVSKNQIVWGANYFTEHLPASMGWIYWDKKIGGDFSDGELAFTSFDRALKSFTYWNGNNGIARIHPTQKPIPLYQWILNNYAKKGNRILDTHGGSMSSAIAADMEGYEMDIVELDSDYFASGFARFTDYYTKKTEIAELGYARTALQKINPTLF